MQDPLKPCLYCLSDEHNDTACPTQSPEYPDPPSLHVPVAIETLIYRDRLGRLRVRARWTRPADSKQMEADEGGVYTDVDDFMAVTVAPLVRRTMRKL